MKRADCVAMTDAIDEKKNFISCKIISDRARYAKGNFKCQYSYCKLEM